ncbi:hypothetical protein HOG17_02000 [Candidatus Peregrinibacteria bacterium]|mgnify:CR=1 FL=1|jgi:hypothetical protein|nr:hypothetical protein [Candidatus Peregrinibacteria bacterium]MBT4147795.1 hypothetical protein [Candidatus Peregrinibacteria bacterium]MBT4366312.1 hypothetical protein [Candidatus Peregrinibacteria bacterium]MBT4456519.1 hypothetical protein [Candidatus Peregrinibacteria bacterium]
MSESDKILVVTEKGAIPLPETSALIPRIEAIIDDPETKAIKRDEIGDIIVNTGTLLLAIKPQQLELRAEEVLKEILGDRD